MRKWFSDLGNFVAALCKQAAGYVTGGVVVAMIAVYQALGGAFQPWHVWALVSLAFFAAGFSLWKNDQRTLAIVQGGLDSHVAQQRTAQEIEAFGNSYLKLYEFGVGLEKSTHLSNPILPQVLDMVVDWQSRVQERLQAEIRPAKLIEYKLIKGTSPHTLEFVLALVFDPYQQGKHRCEMLPEQLQFLHRIIDDPSAFMLPK